MPQFILNKTPLKFTDLSASFVSAYMDAMFFTNCDSGHEDEFRANKLGVERLTLESIHSICHDCLKFCEENAETINEVLAHGERDIEGIAHDFWFTRQGHGVGFWEGESRGYPGDTGEKLTAAAWAFGESECDISRGWIYVR